MIKKGTILLVLACLLALTYALPAQPAQAFVQEGQYSQEDPAGFFAAIWHGLLAPYSLIAYWFIDDVVMYATPNIGWLYDAGFLIGVWGSLPVGWIAAIISTVGHII